MLCYDGGMEGKRSNSWLGVLGVFLVVALLFGVYVGGYFVLGSKDNFSLDSSQRIVWRAFQAEWLITVYKPMGAIESAIMGIDVRIGMKGDDFDFQIGDDEWSS